MSTLTIFSEEIGKRFQFTIKDEDGDLVDLTGATVDLLVFGHPEKGPLALPDPVNGRADYDTLEGDFEPGTYQAQLRVTFSPSSLFLTNEFTLKVGELDC